MSAWQNNGLPDKPAVVLPNRLPQPNPILFELGKNKKTGLAHEFGAGAVCFKCKDACPGLDLHYWRKICKNCKCGKEQHDIPPDDTDPGNLRIGKLLDRPFRSSAEEASFTLSNSNGAGESNGAIVKNGQNKLKFDWIPPNATSKLVEKFMNMLPAEARPIADSEGATRRRVALERQLPLHDYDSKACHELTAEEEKCMKKFVDHFKRDAIGQGVVQEQVPQGGDSKFPNETEQSVWHCHKCKASMFGGEVAVFAERAGNNICWHPACFVCWDCGELLADLIYFYKDDNIFCGRHFGNLLFPRCAACDELIFAKEYTMAEDRPWHLKHFCCYSCDKELGGHRYMFKENQPYCLECYKQIFAHMCATCKQKIDADVNRITHQDIHWHATPECFYCSGCETVLVKQRFVFKTGKVFCSVDCKKKVLG